jgi:hypothetical protein
VNKLRDFTTLGALLYCFQNCSELVGEVSKVGEYGPEEVEEVEELLDLLLNEDVEPDTFEIILGCSLLMFQGVEYIESTVTIFFFFLTIGTHNENDLGLDSGILVASS